MSESAQFPVTPPPEQPGPDNRRDLGGFGRWLRSQGLVRPAGQPVAGVCAALSMRFGIDVTLVRVAMVAVSILLTPAAYGLAWLLLPDGEDHILVEDLLNGRISGGTVGGGVLLLIGLQDGGAFTFSDGSSGYAALMLVGLGVAGWLFIAGRKRREPAHPGRDHTQAGQDCANPADPTAVSDPDDPTPTTALYASGSTPATASSTASTHPQQPMSAASASVIPAAPRPIVGNRPGLGWQATLGIIGAAAIVVGVVALLATGIADLTRADVVGESAAVVGLAAAAAAAVFGLAMIISGLAGRRAGWVTALGLLSAAVGIGAFIAPPHFEVGNQTYAPSEVQNTTRDYGVGNVAVDLARTKPVPGTTPTTHLNLGVGNATITVSEALAVDVALDQGLGNVEGLEETTDRQRIGRDGGDPDLILMVDMGVGNLTVKEVP